MENDMHRSKKRVASPKNSSPFFVVRQNNDLETAEDYVELISDLIQSKGEARVCDIASGFGVSHVTVVRTLQRLQKKGYVTAQQRKPITLTNSGEKLAALSKSKHALLLEYLIFIGVPEEIAAVDAEGMEHHVSVETLEAFRNHLNLKTSQ